MRIKSLIVLGERAGARTQDPVIKRKRVAPFFAMISTRAVDNLSIGPWSNGPQETGVCQPLSGLLFLAEDVHALAVPACFQELHR